MILAVITGAIWLSGIGVRPPHSALPAGSLPYAIVTSSGAVSGRPGIERGVTAYLGIPYAAPPVGRLRWQPPQPPETWDGVREATRFGSDCVQLASGSSPASDPGILTSGDEDCLYLNIWSAARNAKERQPVLFWIHGGGLTAGSGAVIDFDGSKLAAAGAVVVTINYRLGILGFFSHPELSSESPHHASGNYGFLDQIAALRWVQENIAAFGGDPQRVTIFGESAGSSSVSILEASPLAAGLFERGIGESGASFSPQQSLSAAESAGVAFARSVHAGSLAGLRAMDASALVLAQRNQRLTCVDGWMLPETVAAIFAAGRQNDVPTLIGFNTGEGAAYVAATVTARIHIADAHIQYGDRADEYLTLYPANSDQEAKDSVAAAYRDENYGTGMRAWARAQRATGKAPVYLYYFSKTPPGPDGLRWGAHHFAEVPYVFGHLPAAESTAADRRLSTAMMSYWLNFAATGNPNTPDPQIAATKGTTSGGATLPPWPEYRRTDELALLVGETISTGSLPDAAGIDFFDSLRPARH